MVPSILPLTAKNDNIDVKDLGNIARASTILRQHICVDSDEEMWDYLLYKKWQSIAIVPQDSRDEISYRTWYKQIETAHCLDEYDVFQRLSLTAAGRFGNGNQVSSDEKVGELAPLPVLSLTPKDVMFLVDVCVR